MGRKQDDHDEFEDREEGFHDWVELKEMLELVEVTNDIVSAEKEEEPDPVDFGNEGSQQAEHS